MLKEKIESKYGSINKMIDIKNVECKGKLPFTRQHLYDLINHKVENPGIKTLIKLSKLIEIPLEKIIDEYR